MASIIKLEGKKAVTYKVVIRRKGFKTVTRNFPTRKAAKDWARDTEGNHDRMTRLGGGGSRIFLSDAIDKYALQFTGKDQSVHYKLNWWKERLGNIRLSEVRRPDIAEALDGLDRTPASRNRYLSVLSQVFELARDKELIDSNPCKGVKRGEEKSRFGRALSDEEKGRLLDACRQSAWDHMYLLVTLALSTGARRGEIFSLTWNDLDLKKGVAKLSETKNGSPRHLPLIPSVLEQIKALPRPIDSSYCLFPSDNNPHKSFYSGFRRYWCKALEDAGIEDFRFHDLRHSCASYLTEKGIPIVTVAEVLGHRSLSMTQRYSHVYTEQKAKVVAEVFKDLLG
jgi:integrase